MKNIFITCLLISSFYSYLAQASLRVTDYQGNEVVLAKPAQRVIGLAPHVVENLYSAGANERIVGVVSYSNFPEAATKLPIVGDYRRTNYELISELNPDLIVAWNSGRHLDMVNKLRELGFTVYVDDPHKLEDVARSIRDMGVLMGTREASDQAAEAFLLRLKNMRDENADKLTVSVFSQVWMHPLQTLNGEHIISDVIRLCGGQNIFSDEAGLAPKVNIEAVIARNPKAIVAGGMATDMPKWLKAWQQWPVIEAVKNNQVFSIPPDLISRHTVRILDGAEFMCQHLQQVRKASD